jgi:hypothetical protein
MGSSVSGSDSSGSSGSGTGGGTGANGSSTSGTGGDGTSGSGTGGIASNGFGGGAGGNGTTWNGSSQTGVGGDGTSGSGTGGSGTTGTGGSGTGGSGTGTSGTDTSGANGSSSTGTGGAGTSGSGTTTGNGKGNNGNGNGNGNGGSANGGTPGNGNSSSGTGGNSSSGGGNGKGNNGNGVGNGGSNSGDTTTVGGGDGKGGGYTCSKDESGGKSCSGAPSQNTCVAGSHPAACGACVTDDKSGDCLPPSEGGCWITGGGFIVTDDKDNFGGNAKPMRDGSVDGHWNHVDHATGEHALGRPEYIMCRTVAGEPGPKQPGGKKGLTANQVYFGGHARWRSNDVWADGYWFDVVAEDHGEPGNMSAGASFPDTYHFTLRQITDPKNLASGTVVYEKKQTNLTGGNIQIHPSNGGHPAVNSPLPSWVQLED